MRRRSWILCSALVLVITCGGAALHFTGYSTTLRGALLGEKTVADRVAEFGPSARARWSPHFDRAGVTYPPVRVTLVGLKAEKRLDVYASAGADGVPRWIRSYPILAASGHPGPKLKRGDGQVPEGFYAIESLNPNSRFHLALRVAYPNEFDHAMAARDGRTDLGSDIMIHGKAASVGCLAMGDEAAEDLFVLAAETGTERINLILAPADLRVTSAPSAFPDWIPRLYAELATALSSLPNPSSQPPAP